MENERNILIEEAVKSLYGGREYYELQEAKKLDPVGEEDEDIDNDGDSDESDEYLKNRRKKIAKAIKEAKCSECEEDEEDEDEDEEEEKSKKSKKSKKEEDDEDEDEEEEDLKESTHAQRSRLARKARRGEDIGKPGKMFKKVAAKAAKQYGSAERGRKVAAAAMWKHMKEDTDYYTEMLHILSEAGFFESEDDFITLAETVLELFEINDELMEWAPGYASREHAVRREKDIASLSNRIGDYKKGAGPQDRTKNAQVDDIRALRAQRKVTGDKYSGQEAENRKIGRLAQAKRMAEKRRSEEAASVPQKQGFISKLRSKLSGR